jgi:type IV secretion system protein VirB6
MLATVYVMAWGYLHLTGKIDEPVLTGVKRILALGLILGVSLQLWLYNTVIVDTFYNAPAQLAAAIVGSSDPVSTIDTIWESGGAVGDNLWNKGAFSFSSFGFYIAGVIVWCLMGVLCVYAMFLIALSSIALAVLLALGPLFVAMLFFDATRRLFVAWIAQLTNYALITVLTVMVGALLLQIVQSYAAQTAARGTAILTVDALHMVLIAMLVFLILRQVMPIASGLAGGASLNSFGFVSRSVSGGLRGAGRWLERGGNRASPVAEKAERYATPRVVGAVGGTATNVRGTATSLRNTAANLRSNVARSQALSRRLRDVSL